MVAPKLGWRRGARRWPLLISGTRSVAIRESLSVIALGSEEDVGLRHGTAARLLLVVLDRVLVRINSLRPDDLFDIAPLEKGHARVHPADLIQRFPVEDQAFI
jgi:hypothetical protein